MLYLLFSLPLIYLCTAYHLYIIWFSSAFYALSVVFLNISYIYINYIYTHIMGYIQIVISPLLSPAPSLFLLSQPQIHPYSLFPSAQAHSLSTSLLCYCTALIPLILQNDQIYPLKLLLIRIPPIHFMSSSANASKSALGA